MCVPSQYVCVHHVPYAWLCEVSALLHFTSGDIKSQITRNNTMTSRLQVVQGGILCPQVLQEYRGVQWRTSHCCHQLIPIGVQGANLVNPLFEPIPERLEIASCYLLLQ